MMIIIVAVTAFFLTSLSGIWLIPFLRKVKCGQTINDIGPTWHKKKQGTPTMGGFLFLIGVLAASLIGWTMLQFSKEAADSSQMLAPLTQTKFFSGLLMALAFSLIGFADDYVKVVKKRNMGLNERQKTLMQMVVIVIYLAAVYLSGDRSTVFAVPFLGILDFGIFYYPVAAVIIYATVNAVNFTDGLDGLCASVTFVGALGMMLVCTLMRAQEMNILSTALAGGCLGFLIWNFYPAKVMMGDTGSMFLGGLLVAIAFGIGYPVVLVLVGLVHFFEGLSVVIQRTYYKATKGKRIFKMTPIHHHFELSGYSEVKIVLLFSGVALLGSLLAAASVYFL